MPLLLALAICGCSSGDSTKPKAAAAFTAPDGNQKAIVTPGQVLTGKVVVVNSASRFVVVNFPVGHFPAQGQSMNLYRQGLKTGEIKISGYQRDDFAVGDIVAGDAQVGDEVRGQ
jgi:hypothetical protein